MFALERQKRIMELLRENGSVMVNDLSRDFGVTLETVRRDLEKLEQMEQVRRTHGGAVLFEEIALDLSLEKRSGLNIEGKIAIAKKAVKLIRPGDTIFLDSSTTSFYLSKALKELKNITVITNNLLIVNELQACDKIKVIAIGGVLDMGNLSFVGEIALRNIEENFFANRGTEEIDEAKIVSPLKNVIRIATSEDRKIYDKNLVDSSYALKKARKIFLDQLNDWERQKPFYEKKIVLIKEEDNSQKYTWSIFLKTGEVIGQITVQPSEEYPNNSAIRDVGWFVGPKYQ